MLASRFRQKNDIDNLSALAARTVMEQFALQRTDLDAGSADRAKSTHGKCEWHFVFASDSRGESNSQARNEI